jgi:hypothetical protein
MAQPPAPIQFDDLPLEEARKMGRGPRMEPQFYQALDTTATRVTFPASTNPTTMKTRIRRVAAELQVPVTVRKVAGGLLFWRATDDDRQQAREIAARLQGARRRRRRGRPGRQRA